MIDFENYKKNINTKHGRKIVDTNKATSYSGNIDVLKKYKDKEIEKDESMQPLAAAVVGVNNTAAPLPQNPDFFNTWTDVDAIELFLGSKPTCYLILGKPGANAYMLGKSIAKKYHCIHLCPTNILDDEIEQKSSTGTCMDFNIKHNKVITFETVFKLLKIKVESLVIQHRGYVISGFPLITCTRSPLYLINTLYGEESIAIVGEILFDTIANLKKNNKKPRSSTNSQGTSVTTEAPGEGFEEEEEEAKPEEELDEKEEPKVELPKFLLDTCSDVIHPTKAYYNTKKVVLLKQLDDLFSLKLKPDIVVYLSCPDKTLMLKKSHKYINYMKEKIIIEPFPIKTPIEVRWPPQYTTSDDTLPVINQTFNPKYSVRLPMDFQHKSVEQMCNYNRDILPFLENKLKEFDPNYIIKIDARKLPHEMMHEVSERVLIMAIKPVIIPEPLFMEDLPDEIDEFWKMVEELNVIRSGTAAFNRLASPWSNRCPVELKKRISERGNPKLAISFLKHVYLAASLNNLISFYKNPRPFLKLKYLEPTCRIIVIGTKLAGKTMISECLSWLFDAPIINYDEILKTEVTKKYDVYAKTILSEIIPTIEDARFEIWHNSEMIRLTNLDRWCQTTIVLLKKYIPHLKEYLHKQQLQRKKREKEPRIRQRKKTGEGTEEPKETEELEEIEEPEEMEMPPIDTAFMNKFNTMRSNLSFLPFLDKLDECQESLSANVISKYAPKETTTPKDQPTLPVLGDKDVTDSIAAYIEANELQKEIYPSTEEITGTIKNIITSIDAQHQKRTMMDEMYGKYIFDGFPSDPEYWSILAESKLLPDYTVALVENREIEPELLENYKMISDCVKHHQERYLSANDPLIKSKLKLQKPPDNKDLDIKIIIHDFFKDSILNKEEPTEIMDSPPELEPWVSFSETIEKFKEDWDTIKLKLEEYSKCFVDVQLENKSDIEVVEDVMLQIRKSYYLSCEVIEEDDFEEQDDETDVPKDILTYNNPINLGETGKYCPISYYKYGVLWEGKPEFSVKFDGKLYRLSNEGNLEAFQNDVTKYQSYNKPLKTLPPLRICIIGGIGSGKTTVAKLLAKELGLMHLDFSKILNDLLMPKHFKKVGLRYENNFTDVPIDDEAIVEFQMDEGNENLISDIMSSETELRKMVYNYYERGSQILPQLMQNLITKLWFENPFVNTGFVLDGYPKLSADVEDMTTCYCIPDLIIELESSSENTVARHAPNLFKTWKNQLNEAKENAKKKLTKDKREWMNFLTKNVVVKIIIDEILENMFFSSEPIQELSNESVLLDANPGGSIIDTNLFNKFNEMVQEFPEPVDQSVWEKGEDVRERIESRLEGIYESDDENIQALKELLSEQRIKTVSINGNKSLTKVTRLALSKITNLRNRNESYFEETLVISPDIAEVLLLDGFCILSNKFKRMCPVYIFENPNAIQSLYNVFKRKDAVFPVVHRFYMYFIYGQENLEKFRLNPLKYVTGMNICNFIGYPLRISVIGAPKSGKSTLCSKLAKRYGLLCLSRGIAVRNVLDNKQWTELGAKMLVALTAGKCISSELVMKAVQMMATDHRTITNGFVFDGFPETATEATELVRDGFYPDIVFDISADIRYVAESSQKEIYYDLLKRNPPYCRAFIENRYTKWQERSFSIRDWIKSDYQNLYQIDGNTSKWKCLMQAVDLINGFITKVHYYLTKVKTDVVPVDFLCISNEEFENRMSPFKHMCPLCYLTHNLKHNGDPVIKKGVVQYRNHFYWICPEHIDMVLKNPLYLKPEKIPQIPELPLIVKRVNMTLVYEKGICIVTYAEHLPTQMLVVGTIEYAASYKGNRYLFCSKSCHDKFLAKPHLYYNITVFRNATVARPLTLKGLPNIGYLEQTVGILITEACVSVTVHRPKYPGLTYQLSALLHIALYFKTHNSKINEDKLARYKKVSKCFDAKCRLVSHVGLLLRSMDNPFAKYPKCCDYVKSDSKQLTNSSSRSDTFSSYES